MTGCKHESFEYVGEQKTDDGVNTYRRCRNCGTLFIMTPSEKLIAVPGVAQGQPATVGKKARS